jgi:hypothetical protein
MKEFTVGSTPLLPASSEVNSTVDSSLLKYTLCIKIAGGKSERGKDIVHRRSSQRLTGVLPGVFS